MIKNGLTDVVKKLLENPECPINVQNQNGQTPLMLSAKLDQADILATLIQQSSPIDQKDNNGKTALHYAAQKGNADNIQKLINAGASLNIKDNNSKTPIDVTSNADLKTALDNYQTNRATENNIFYAIHKKDTKRIEYLINEDNTFYKNV